jgi:hypothetical protein
MKKSKLRNIIRESIKELMTEHQGTNNFNHHVDPNDPPATVATVYGGPGPLGGNGNHKTDYVAFICPALYALAYNPGTQIGDIANWNFINDMYDQAGMNTLPPQPNPGVPNTQMFSCFQVHPVAESWYSSMHAITGTGAPPLGSDTHADLPQIGGQYANIQAGVADGWLFPGTVGNCSSTCGALAVNYVSFDCDNQGNCYDPLDGTGPYATLADCQAVCQCQEPVGGCPDFQTPWGPVGQIWQPAPVCACLSPSVGPSTTDNTIEPYGGDTLTHADNDLDSKIKCSCCNKITHQSISMTTTVDPAVGCQSLEIPGQIENCQTHVMSGGAPHKCAPIGCTDPTALNFCPTCVQDDGTCIYDDKGKFKGNEYKPTEYNTDLNPKDIDRFQKLANLK